MTKNNYFVITGAMGAGKSTILNVLKDRGFICIDEPAREILKEQRSISGNGVPEKNPELFNELMLSRMIFQFNQHSNIEETVFFDRGMADIIAYSKLLNTSQGRAVNASVEYRYNKHVFFLPGWEGIYCKDEERKVDFEVANSFGNNIRDIYQELGYIISDVLLISVEERAEHIIYAVKKLIV
ncbi:MAG: AAA family ATPase [Ignavibacteria bacterium]|nr:AAA family ATPase [Ignavibacteria bacterium]